MNNEIDVLGVLSLLNPEKENGKFCFNCNLHYMRSAKLRCQQCPFVFNTKYFSGYSKVAPGSKFRNFNIPNVEKFGKHHLFYFLYYPELNFQLPPIPEYNMFGVQSTDRTTWHIHHINGQNWDDSIWNLMLLLNNEHVYFENIVKREKQREQLLNKEF